MEDEKNIKMNESGKPDKGLIEKALHGDKQAFIDLIQRYYRIFYRIAYGYIQNHDKVEDILQEAIYQIYKDLRTLRDLDRFGSWAYTIIRRECIHTLRIYYKEKQHMSEYTSQQQIKHIQDTQKNSIGNFIDLNNQKDLISHAIYQLPKIYRDVAILYFFEHMNCHEISELLAIHKHTVDMRLSRLKKFLRNQIKDME